MQYTCVLYVNVNLIGAAVVNANTQALGCAEQLYSTFLL